MNSLVSYPTRQEVVAALRGRYRSANRAEKSRILDEFVALTGAHRKHAIRTLRTDPLEQPSHDRKGRRIYDEAIRQALVVVWEAADRICGKRLKAVLPDYVDAMERHGHLNLDPEVKRKLLMASAATVDRLLKPMREKASSKRKKRSRSKPSQKVKVKTSGDWKQIEPGYLEIDFVVHSGGSMSGEMIHSLVVTDVCSGWTDAVPLLAREQSLVVEGLKVLADQLPMPIRGVDSDNDSAFINDTLISFCKDREIEFTRSRPYQSNDQAWIEQKNGAVIRKIVGHARFSGVVAAQTMATLYQSVRLYVNYFQPSFQLISKTREGSKVKKEFSKPKTPCDRLLADSRISHDCEEKLRKTKVSLDPLKLLHTIRQCQAALASLSTSDSDGLKPSDLDDFLAKLPKLWEQGEVRPTHRKAPATERDWRTRADPFSSTWHQVLEWLEEQPDATAKSLLGRLQAEYPNQFDNGQLRTLQRRVSQWRAIMARQLVHQSIKSDPEEK